MQIRGTEVIIQGCLAIDIEPSSLTVTILDPTCLVEIPLRYNRLMNFEIPTPRQL